MFNTKVVLAAVAFVVVLITAASFVTLGTMSRPTEISRADKAELIYEHSSQLLAQGDQKPALRGLTEVAEKYPASEYSERAMKDLASYYASSKKDKAKAGYYYKKILEAHPDAADAEGIKAEMDKLNVKKQSAPAIAGGGEYVVVPGDSLYKIAQKYKTTVELIKQANGLKSDVIVPGQKLKVSMGTFSILVDKSANTLVLKKDGEVVKTYTVATGKEGSTPVGAFTIVSKAVKPVWTKPDGTIVPPDSPDYEIGARWIALSRKGYGIHGTNDESMIGKSLTAGCIRMHNSDVIELYDIVTEGVKVEVVDGGNTRSGAETEQVGL